MYDPVGLDNARKIYDDKINYCDNIEEALKDADMCFIMTEWEDIKSIKPEEFLELMNEALIYDGRNCYDPKVMADNNIKYYSIGRASY